MLPIILPVDSLPQDGCCLPSSRWSQPSGIGVARPPAGGSLHLSLATAFVKAYFKWRALSSLINSFDSGNLAASNGPVYPGLGLNGR